MEAFEKVMETFTKEINNDKEKEDGLSAQFEQIMANMTIDIERVHFRFEDEDLHYAIGILIPNINCLSCDKTFSPMDWINDPSVLYKKLKIDDISVYINTKSTFKSLQEMIYLDYGFEYYQKNMT